MANERTFQYCLVAFIDVLGQRQAFDGIDRLPQSRSEHQHLDEVLTRTVGFVEVLRDGFISFFSTFSRPTEIANSLPPEEREVFRALRKIDVGLRSFSDSVVADVSLKGVDQTHIAVNSICGVLGASGAMMLVSLMAQHAVRGGIEVAPGIRLKSGEVYGPVLNRAYALEANVAQYPRLVVGPGLIQYLKAVREQRAITPQAKIAILGAELAQGMIAADLDGALIVDYLSPGFRRVFTAGPSALGQPVPEFDSWVTTAFAFVEQEHKRWKAAKNKKLADRYGLLESYFRSRM